MTASTTFAVGPAGAAPLIHARAAATVATTSETATARPTVLGNFMGTPLLPARGTAARRNSFNPCRGGRVCSSGPVDPTIGC